MPINFRNPESGQSLWYDTATTAVSLAYDLRNRLVVITLTPNTAGSTSATHWLFDWETKSLWKMQFGGTNTEPFCLHSRRNFIATSSAHSTVLLGCRDGYVRRFENTATDDDGESFESFVWLGPIGDNTLFSSTQITELVGILARNSGSIRWGIYAGDCPEDAFNSEAIEEGIWEKGRNFNSHPRASGGALYLKLSGVDNDGWGFEGASMIITPAGRVRP